MAATPPLQIRSSIRTPSTPLHGPTFDTLDSTQRRYATRASQRRSSQEPLSTPDAVKPTPRSRREIPLADSLRRSSRSSTPNTVHTHSPQQSPRRKATRRVQITSPTSPGLGSPAPTPIPSSNLHPTFLSSNTIMAEGMLPTPVKTPRKKNIPSVNLAPRALFHDQPVLGEEDTTNPRRGRRGRRYNGFTLESFSAGEEVPGNIQIFTDSRDNVPQLDTNEGNPFIDHPSKADGSSRRAAGTSKRRKVSGEQKIDPQIQQAIDNDEGMLYVFRGKKIYRKFDDGSEEEEEIDTAELGLLDHNGDLSSVAPLKTLTRKSIKPSRLFQTAEQKRVREVEKEEEALTDIEEQPSVSQLTPSPSTPVKNVESETPASPPPTGRALRSNGKKEITEADPVGVSALEKSKAKKPKRASPFDSWKRVKAGTTAVTADPSKSRKRGPDALDEGDVTSLKKTKAD